MSEPWAAQLKPVPPHLRRAKANFESLWDATQASYAKAELAANRQFIQAGKRDASGFNPLIKSLRVLLAVRERRPCMCRRMLCPSSECVRQLL